MGYNEDIIACKTEKELFKLWKTKKPCLINYGKNKEKTVCIDHKNVFISDGVVNKTVWDCQKGKKIAYVLKEAYGDNTDWDLTQWLLEATPSSATWKRVIEWTYGILNTNENKIARYLPDIFECNKELFNNIAVINLKKSSGKSFSDYEEIKAYAISDKIEIKQQLKIISPDIIICGSTFNTLNHIYEYKLRPKGTGCDNWYYYTDLISDKITTVIDYYHPANHYPALVNYYAITNIYQQSLYKKDFAYL